MNVSILIVFLSFLLLGTILTFTFTNYWSEQKRTQLDARAANISTFIRQNSAVNPGVSGGSDSIYINQSDKIREFLELYVRDAEVDIIVTDTNAHSVLVVTRDENMTSYLTVPPEAVNHTIRSGSYFGFETLGRVYETEHYVCARPIYYNNGGGIMGIVFVASGSDDIESFTSMVMRIFLLSAVAALSVSVLGIGIFSYNMVKPLRQMAEAATRFGKGDFSIRVTDTGGDEIGQLAVAFNNMAESLASSESIRRSFVANVSHELKTPMTTIAGFIDGILDGTIPPERQGYYLHIVSDEVKRLSRLVHSMLDLSRLDSGELKLNYQTFDMLDTLVTIIITFEQQIEQKHIDIRGLDLISSKLVYGDKDLLYQVIYNLIENAVKFTNENGYIEFNITESLERFDFTIKNSGTGIKSGEIGMVFDRFYKTDKSRSQDKKGLGLGLYLVRSIIRLHGGDITAESVYGEYCEFNFYIPKRQINKKQEKKALP